MATRAVVTVGGTALMALGVAVPQAEAAQTFVPCLAPALGTAITAATPGDTLFLAPGCVYSLTSALPVINKAITIRGNGATITRASGAFRILEVGTTGDLDLRQAIISNGDATGSYGGGIRNDGNLSVTQSIIRDNKADYSGGIGASDTSTTKVIQSIISGNSATQNGGGLANDGSMTIRESSFLKNTADGKGGGVANDGTLQIVRSTFMQNAAGTGGGIANFKVGSSAASATLSQSVVIANKATTAGAPGGILNDNGSVTLSLSVVLANSPTNCAGSPTPVPGCLS
jgi:hypothetical protein